MAVERHQLAQLLEHAGAAFGFDLVLPPARIAPRAAGTRAAAEPAPAAGPAAPAPPEPATPAVPVPARPARTPPPLPPDPLPAEAAAEPTPAPRGEATAAVAGRLLELRREVLACTRCPLHEGRKHAVFGEGNDRARVLFVGEAPGATEDQTGRPFVGAAGQLLDRIIAGAMGLRREDVYIANVNKCRPPGNREPAPNEVAACLPYLRQQIAWIRPEVIVCLGRVAAQNLLGSHESTTKLRGRTLAYEGVPVIVTWHPAYLLRDPSHKRETWEDIKRVNRLLGLPEVPGAG